MICGDILSPSMFRSRLRAIHAVSLYGRTTSVFESNLVYLCQRTARIFSCGAPRLQELQDIIVDTPPDGSSSIVSFNPMLTIRDLRRANSVLVCAHVQSTHKLVNPPYPLIGMPAHPSPAALSDQSRQPAANSLR
jgi:hypothetical protein